MKDERAIWVVTKDGRPMYCAWGLVKTYAEGETLGASIGKKAAWAAVLGPTQLAADGWDATPTQWRRVHDLVTPVWLAHDADTPATIEDGKVKVAGVSWEVNGKGRDRARPDMEPDEPDCEIDDEDVLLDQIERKKGWHEAEIDRVGAANGTPANEIAAAKNALKVGVRLRDKFGKTWEAHAGGKPNDHGNPNHLLYKEGGVKKRDDK